MDFTNVSIAKERVKEVNSQLKAEGIPVWFAYWPQTDSYDPKFTDSDGYDNWWTDEYTPELTKAQLKTLKRIIKGTPFEPANVRIVHIEAFNAALETLLPHTPIWADWEGKLHYQGYPTDTRKPHQFDNWYWTDEDYMPVLSPKDLKLVKELIKYGQS